MRSAQRLKVADFIGDDVHIADFRRDGYAIVRGLFDRDEVAQIAAAIDQLYAEGIRHGRSFRHGNLFYDVATAAGADSVVRMAQWPSYHQPVLNQMRLDTRIADLLEPLLGPSLKQIINQVHWKAQGS